MTHRHRVDPPHALRDMALRAILFLFAMGYALSVVSCGAHLP